MDSITDILVDCSGSMNESFREGEGDTKFDIVTKILGDFVTHEFSALGHMVGVRWFQAGQNKSIIEPIATTSEELTDAFSALPAPNGGTPLSEAVNDSIETLLSLREEKGRANLSIILLTDGEADDPGSLDRALMRARELNVNTADLLKIYPIGIGALSNSTKSTIEKISKATDSESLICENPDQASGFAEILGRFRQIAERRSSNPGRFIAQRQALRTDIKIAIEKAHKEIYGKAAREIETRHVRELKELRSQRLSDTHEIARLNKVAEEQNSSLLELRDEIRRLRDTILRDTIQDRPWTADLQHLQSEARELCGTQADSVKAIEDKLETLAETIQQERQLPLRDDKHITNVINNQFKPRIEKTERRSKITLASAIAAIFFSFIAAFLYDSAKSPSDTEVADRIEIMKEGMQEINRRLVTLAGSDSQDPGPTPTEADE